MNGQKQENERFSDENRLCAGLAWTYDLRGDGVGRKIPLELEDVKEFALPLIHIIEDCSGLGLFLAASMKDEQFPDTRKLLQRLVNADLQSSLIQLLLKQRGQHQRQDAIEGMNTDFLISPMEHRLPRDEMRVLHGPECVLNLVLPPVSQHNVLIGPIVAVREDQGLAEEGAAEPVNSGGIDAIGQAGQLVWAMKPQRDVEDFLHMASNKDLIKLLLGPAEGGRLTPFVLSFNPAVEPLLHLMELPFAFLDLLHEGGELFRVEVVVEGHQNRALNAKDLLLGAVGANRFEAFPLEGLEVFAVYGQKFGVVGGNQGTDKPIGAFIEKLHAFLRVVSLIKDKRDLGASFGEGGITLHQFVKDSAKLNRVGDVPIIRLMEQGDMEVRGSQKGEADLAKVVTPIFVMSPLRQFPLGARADEGEEVGGVQGEAAQIDLVYVNDPVAKIGLDGEDLLFPQVAHVIPKLLAGQLAKLGRAQPPQDGLSVPGRQSTLALGTCGAVDGGQSDILAHGKPLIPFGNMRIDNSDEIEFFHDAPDRRNRAELGDGDPLYGGRASGFCDRGHNIFDSPEVDGARDPRSAVDPAALAGVIVRMPPDNLFGEACHVRS